ncbi:MAG: chromosome segregation protein SMC [Alphaproteobacteria bacterium]|nr:chromosome segregation protein SMC [Alphaproteobacteria bacterium]
MHFTKMKITGFKSFVEPTEFVIEQGLTGIVGPNGCGKSNVVESLRWVMGENSAKRLRGGEMDDVIFSGSAGRPARNLAEVTLYMDNSERSALAEFNSEDEIEIIRHIERGQGSDYRINGKPVRQKDVQLFFADQATGAHSTSIVSQGRISALIQAKPTERRQVLEEAAGISGLHARRHEAELKLKGAEGNLTRVDDQLQVMETQIRSLKTQVRQASRYRNLGELIRKAEAGLLYLKAKQAEVNFRLSEDTHAESEGRVRELTSIVTQVTTQRTEMATTLPPLRQAEAAASAVVQRLILEREALEKESARIAGEQAALNNRLQQTNEDAVREQALASDASAALARLEEEQITLKAEAERLAIARPDLEAAASLSQSDVAAQEKTVQEITQHLASAEAQYRSLQRQEAALAERQKQVQQKKQQLEQQIAELDAEIARLPSLALALSMVEACETDLTRKQNDAETAKQTKGSAEQTQSDARSARERAWSEKTTLEAESAALTKLLQLEENSGTPLSDLVKVEPGYEAALAAALGDALSAPLEDAQEIVAGIFWRELPPLENTVETDYALPSEARSIKAYVECPAALKRALSQIGLVSDDATGERLSAALKPGQVLVSQSGAAWRWDGYTQKADAVTPAAARLQHRNRLAELNALITYSAGKAEQAESLLSQANQAMQQASARDSEAQSALQQAFAALNDARRNQAQETQAQAHKAAQAQRVRDLLQANQGDEQQLQTESEALEAQRSQGADLEELNRNLNSARIVLAEQRQVMSEKQAALSGYQRDMRNVETRLASVTAEQQSWGNRASGAATRIAELQTRQQELTVEAQNLAEKPQAIEAQRQELLTNSAAAEEKRREAADALQSAETQLAQVEKQARQQEEALSSAKENRVRSEEQMYQAQHAFEALKTTAQEQWHCAADGLLEKAEVKDASELPAINQLEHDFARFTKEREHMGPVNLRAEIEAEEIQTQFDKMASEKDDLVQAIAKLRQAIGTLNKEARERLQTAFDEVNKNFSDLFTRMFGGGKAHLQLIENDDPLEAGLEIFACPPGKRLQALSLLSGGEQALTALSLLFALFLVNPSPICVLDEVDAPLDEANVDRYCSLLREMAESGKTRFLVITHHRLTMARMDRLYGVTMAEKGVSQLVSVDLKQALALREQGEASNQNSAYAEAAAE